MKKFSEKDRKILEERNKNDRERGVKVIDCPWCGDEIFNCTCCQECGAYDSEDCGCLVEDFDHPSYNNF